jgi:chaperonin GroES
MITLTRDLIGVQPIKDSEKTSGGLWIPDEAKERADQGIVKYVGPKCRDIKIGDYVLFSGYTGTTVQLEKDADGCIIIMRERFVVAILNAPDTEVSGLYFRGDNEYFPATYEMAMNIIAEAFRDHPFAKTTGFKNPLGARFDRGSTPLIEDYNAEDDDYDDDDFRTYT